MRSALWRSFYFIFVIFCVLIVAHDFFDRSHPNGRMGYIGDLVVAIIIGVLLIAPEVIRAMKARSRVPPRKSIG